MFVVYALKPVVLAVPGPAPRPDVPYPDVEGLQCTFEVKALTDEFESKDMATLAKTGLLVPEGYKYIQVLDTANVVEGHITLPMAVVSPVGAN